VTKTTNHWLGVLDAADFWCAPVLMLSELVAHDGFAAIGMDQEFSRVTGDGSELHLKTTRAPVRFDGEALRVSRGAPRVGEHTEAIDKEFRGS
jgi:CoA:oxalate CoA-transferase